MTKFENEYELYYKRAAADDGIEADDGVEEAFEALHRAAEAEQQLLYASRKFDTAVPRHALLDTSLNKNKSRPGHRQSARERGRQQVDERKLVIEENSNMKIGTTIVSTNAAREFRQKENSPRNKKKGFNLGIEPDVIKPSENILTVQKQKFPQSNEYEDIRVFQKRKKKKKNSNVDLDTFESVDQKSNFHNKEETNRCEAIPIGSVNIASNEDHSNLNSNEIAKVSNSRKKTINTRDVKSKSDEEKKPFESFQNCLFTIFTSCVPWSCMRRVYWRKEHKSEDIFTKTSRRNSRGKFR